MYQAALAEGTSYMKMYNNIMKLPCIFLSAWGATFLIMKKNNGKYIYKIQGGLSTKKE